MHLLRACLFLLGALALAQPPTPVPDWSAWSFLLGDWEGEGGGKPGEATRGGFTFETQLGGRLLVRKNFAEYAASRHEDWLIVYPESGQGRKRATYFDNEGHVIEYAVEELEPGKMIRFTSAATAAGPRFRLILARRDESTVSTRFEIAPPGKPEAFALYVEGVVRRKTR